MEGWAEGNIWKGRLVDFSNISLRGPFLYSYAKSKGGCMRHSLCAFVHVGKSCIHLTCMGAIQQVRIRRDHHYIRSWQRSGKSCNHLTKKCILIKIGFTRNIFYLRWHTHRLILYYMHSCSRTVDWLFGHYQLLFVRTLRPTLRSSEFVSATKAANDSFLL